MTSPVLRCGLVGTGFWARTTHAIALASTPGVELTAVWGRNEQAARDLAAEHSAAAFAGRDEFLDAVDAVVFSVPPDVQSDIALAAARAGKHLLLEKPLALTLEAADALVGAIEESQVASAVFFTARFDAAVRAWLDEVTGTGPWLGGSATWLASGLRESSPFNTPWRRAKGGLWDLGPHVTSLLWASLGPVTSVTAQAGPADVTHLILRHQGGASSTATVTLSAPPAAETVDAYVWGEPGRRPAPVMIDDSLPPLRTALTELAANAAAGRTDHPCDARFGRDIVRLLAEAERQVG